MLKNDGSGENNGCVQLPPDRTTAFKIARALGWLGLPPEQSIDTTCSDGRAAIEENLGDPGTEVADVIRPKEFAGGADDLRQAAHDLEIFGIEPSALATILLVHYAAANWALSLLADPCCEERSVRDIVEGKRVAHENDVICLLDHDAHFALDLLQKRRRRGLEARLHDHRGMVRIGQGLAVDACAGVDHAKVPFATFLIALPPAIESDGFRKGLQGGRREQGFGVDLPSIANVGRKLAAVRTLAPPQAAVREQMFADSDADIGSVVAVVELPGRRNVHGLPDLATRVVFLDPGTGDEVTKVMVELHPAGRTADVRDVGSSIEGAVGDKLGPKPNRIPVHTHDADVAQYELEILEIVRSGSLGDLEALRLHPSAHLGGKVIVMVQVGARSGRSYASRHRTTTGQEVLAPRGHRVRVAAKGTCHLWRGTRDRSGGACPEG